MFIHLLPMHKYGLYKSVLIFLILAGCVPAKRVTFSPSLPAGTECVVDVRILRPTQFAVGYWEIDRRAEKVVTKGAKKLEKYLEEHVGQIVIGPGGVPYIIDRHHLACIMQRTGKSPTIYAIVQANFKTMEIDSFWKEMAIHNWTYLFDNKGDGPLDPRELPKSVEGLQDDPFRSLAWAVREQGGYRKSDEPFAEFQWANFFRAKLITDNANATMEHLIEEALKLCHTPAARGLPGYCEVSVKSE
jgi:hypothetical protein